MSAYFGIPLHIILDKIWLTSVSAGAAPACHDAIFGFRTLSDTTSMSTPDSVTPP